MKEFIDARNIKLWESLKNDFNIQIKKSKNNEYSCFTKNNEAIIFVDFNNISKDSFTHELLHIYLKQKEFYLGDSIKNYLKGSRVLEKLLSDNLLEHIGNCLDHLKMFILYDNLGFEKRNFLLDYNEHKCNSTELLELKRNFKLNKKINPNAIDFYIGKLIAMLCDPNVNNDYFNELIEFKKIDNELYSIIDKLVIETIEFEIEIPDPLKSYRDISHRFYSRILNWIYKNKIK